MSEHVIQDWYTTLEEALKCSLALAREGYHTVISPDNLLVNFEWVANSVKGHFLLYECRMPMYTEGKKYAHVLPHPATIHSLLFEEKVETTIYIDKDRKPTDINEVVLMRVRLGLTEDND